MTREEITEKVLQSTHCIVSGATGIGKTKIAIEKANSLVEANILIVVPQLTIIDSWKEEFSKWRKEGTKFTVRYTTYKSLDKHIEHRYDLVVFDESHHITTRVLDIIKSMWFENMVCLSATMKRETISFLKILFNDIKVFRLSLSEAIENNILPDPKIILIPLTLNPVSKTELIIKNPKALVTKEIPFEKRNCYRDKTTRYVIKCTEVQYNLDLDATIERFKSLTMNGNSKIRNIWLHKAGDRLKWLSNKKIPYVLQILKKLDDKRTITFCNSIEQTEKLGRYAIHSKNKIARDVLEAFNTAEINHITAVAQLDEGVNLYQCQIAVFANINSSERLQCQRVGRAMRHKEPIIIFPYFVNTREEEIVEKMIVGYNKDFIKRMTLKEFLENEDNSKN